MKLLIVDTYYSRALDLHAETPSLQSQPYATQWRLLVDQCFGTAELPFGGSAACWLRRARSRR